MAQAKMLSKRNTLQGFTIIEVVLVLAIAGLIFLMVFIALPALQRNQRDTQRRQDYANLSSAVTGFTTNNNGKLPTGTGTSTMKATDLNADGKDPDGYAYDIKYAAKTVSDAPKLGKDNNGKTEVYIVTQSECKNGVPSGVNSTRAFAVYGPVEGGNGTYCQSNS
jgi:prepilin-type N-terminal cleavage/methylation domain-containing protein